MKNRIRLLVFFMTILFMNDGSFGQGRRIVSLNEGWSFILADKEADYLMLPDSTWTNVYVPHTWNNKDIQSGGKVNYGTGWYKKNLNNDEFKISKKYFLQFEGVGQYAEIYINNKFIGKHLGSYSAFVFDITDFINPEINNVLAVKVNNELASSYPKDNFLFGIFGGIYRDVNLIETNELYIGLTDNASNGVYVHQKNVDSVKALLNIEVLLTNETSRYEDVLIKNKLINKNKEVVAQNTIKKALYPGGLNQFSMDLNIDNPVLWNGRINPYLYSLETEIIHKGQIVDKVVQNIGIRYFDISPEKGFSLNGKPYRLYGVCRHQEWENLGNALLPQHHKQDMELIYEIGATSVRLAHYQQAEYVYDLADSLGFLVWAEIPFVNGYNEGADDNARQQLTELIKQNFNHPSIFVWGIHNEVVKGGVVQEPTQLTRELNSLCKTLDPSRYTVSVSNIWWEFDHSIHEKSDLQGFNQYTGWYGGKPTELEKWINNYHKAKPDIRFSISEYGAGGNVYQQSSDIVTPPDPLGQFFPEGYQTYYHEVTYSSIEKYPYIWASYVWNMFDFSVPEWDRGGIKGRNHKGLVTYDRKIKKDAFYWYKANWSEEPVLYLTGKRNDSIEVNECIFKAYCNFGSPQLFIDGKDYGKMKQGINSVQYLSQAIHLEKGQHKVGIKAICDGNFLNDEFTLEIK